MKRVKLKRTAGIACVLDCGGKRSATPLSNGVYLSNHGAFVTGHRHGASWGIHGFAPRQSSQGKLMQVKAGYCSLLQAILQKKIFYNAHASGRSVNGGRDAVTGRSWGLKPFQPVPKRSKPFQPFFRKKRLFIFFRRLGETSARTSVYSVALWQNPTASYQKFYE